MQWARYQPQWVPQHVPETCWERKQWYRWSRSQGTAPSTPSDSCSETFASGIRDYPPWPSSVPSRQVVEELEEVVERPKKECHRKRVYHPPLASHFPKSRQTNRETSLSQMRCARHEGGKCSLLLHFPCSHSPSKKARAGHRSARHASEERSCHRRRFGMVFLSPSSTLLQWEEECYRKHGPRMFFSCGAVQKCKDGALALPLFGPHVFFPVTGVAVATGKYREDASRPRRFAKSDRKL